MGGFQIGRRSDLRALGHRTAHGGLANLTPLVNVRVKLLLDTFSISSRKRQEAYQLRSLLLLVNVEERQGSCEILTGGGTCGRESCPPHSRALHHHTRFARLTRTHAKEVLPCTHTYRPDPFCQRLWC